MLIKLVENSPSNPSNPNSQVNSQVTQPTFTFFKVNNENRTMCESYSKFRGVSVFSI